MAIIKCKMCGGDLEVTSGITVVECEYCGTKQTLPKVNEEVIQNLFNRANALRLKCEFDKAEQIYEKILHENNAESEAHWGIVLCKYGIEYVEDPKTYKRIPTCHRTSYDAVTADPDYMAAIEHADTIQRSIYETEAKAIDEIQKNILSIVKDEKPFDVFICYKETDENGKRTIDSTIANDIYYQLTQEGLKVFYAAITLEDKLGSAYEPYIFAALNSAKVMLVIGTKPQYFTAVWVKNEWSRFLKLMKSDRSKLLIPCYKDMVAYELPEEFAHLQAQDMSKIGFINDIVRGIKKVAVKAAPKAAMIKETVVTAGNTNTTPLLKRAFMFLEDGEWDRADDFCEQVLNIDPECAQAYLGKLMVELKIRRREDLSQQLVPFDSNPHYKKALRFGDDKLQSELTDSVSAIILRAERVRMLAVYKKAETLLASASSKEDYISAAETFSSISGFEDADERAKECREKYDEVYFGGLYNTAKALMKYAKSEEDFRKAEKAFDEIKEYKDAGNLATECAEKAVYTRKNAVYSAAFALMTGNNIQNYKKAISKFEKIRGFKDSDKQIEWCNGKIEQISAAILAADVERQNRARMKKEAFRKRLPIIKKIALVVVPVLILAIAASILLPIFNGAKDTTTDGGASMNQNPNNESSSGTPDSGTPDTGTPDSGTPDTGTPDSGTPDTGTPDTGTPDSGTPDTGTPDTGTPGSGTQTPSTQTPSTQTPSTQTPSTQTPSTQTPSTQTPSTQTPSTQTPSTQTPSTQTPSTQTPSTQTPSTQTPSTEAVAVPYVVGSTQAQATSALQNAGFAVNIVKATSNTVPAGNVISQTPAAGTSQGKGSTVTLTVSSGTEAVTVPNVVGKTKTNAITALQSAGLKANIQTEYSNTVAESLVISQSTPSGTQISKGSTITIVISLGRNPEPVTLQKDGLTYTAYSDGTATVTGYTGEGGNVTIPSQIDGYNVTSIGDYAFFNCNSRISVTIPGSVKSIGDYAFAYSKLVSLIISEGVTYIGGFVFEGCYSLTSVTIPKSFKSIPANIFAGCTSLNSVTIPEGIESIGENAFAMCYSLASVTIPGSVKTIGNGAFDQCERLASITICEGVESIGVCAFWDCGFSSITIPGSVENITGNIGSSDHISTITICEGVKTIGKGAFSSLHGTTSIIIPESVISIESDAFLYDRAHIYFSSEAQKNNLGHVFTRDVTLSVR